MPARTLYIELLELRQLFDVDAWHNSTFHCDVDGDGLANPIDALLIINDLNQFGARPLRDLLPLRNHAIDTNGDEVSSAIDLLAVVNLLNLYGAPTQLTAAVQNDLDGNWVVLDSAITVTGATLPSASVVARFAQQSVNVFADSNGVYSIPVSLEAGLTTVTVEVMDPRGRKTTAPLDIRLGNVADNWNATALNVIRAWTGVSNDPYQGRIVPSQPPMVARNLAMIHIAMFDAANAIDPKFDSYLPNLPAAPIGASQLAATIGAAYEVSTALYRDADERSLWDAALVESFRGLPDDEAKAVGLAYGRDVGRAVLAFRANDGASSTAVFPSGTEPGEWRRTYPDYLPPLLPQWPNVKPFAVTSIGAIRPAAPPALDSAEYAEAVDQVMRLGALQNSERTEDETAIALFWADGGGTATPPGHWNRIAADVSMAKQLPLVDATRMYSLLNIAMADAGIASWDAKYAYGLWRPIDAIRQGETDGNPSTLGQDDWLPLLKTPPFPTYTSGHSTFSGAAATVLTDIFGDSVAFTSATDPQNAPSQRPLADEYITKRQFTSFWQAAEEAGMSRIYGGIHFSFDNSAGLDLGEGVAQAAIQLLTPALTEFVD